MLAEARQEAEDRVWGPVGELSNFTDLEVREQDLAAPAFRLRARAGFSVQHRYDEVRFFTLEVRRDPDGELLAIT